jgi:hypothetical protein
MPLAAIAAHWYTIGAAAIALVGVALTVLINGARAERQRRRDLHARALTAILAYGEMPYRIQRRAPGAENRARLSDELSRIKAELGACQVLLAADGDERLSAAFDDLYELARRTIGNAAHDAWNAPLIQSDKEMNQGKLYRRLSAFNAATDKFADNLRTATLPRHNRAGRWVRSKPGVAHLPFVHRPRATPERRPVAPQDLISAAHLPGAGARAEPSAVEDRDTREASNALTSFPKVLFSSSHEEVTK